MTSRHRAIIARGDDTRRSTIIIATLSVLAMVIGLMASGPARSALADTPGPLPAPGPDGFSTVPVAPLPGSSGTVNGDGTITVPNSGTNIVGNTGNILRNGKLVATYQGGATPGTAVYFRVRDANNWMRVNLYAYTGTHQSPYTVDVPYTWTETVKDYITQHKYSVTKDVWGDPGCSTNYYGNVSLSTTGWRTSKPSGNSCVSAGSGHDSYKYHYSVANTRKVPNGSHDVIHHDTRKETRYHTVTDYHYTAKIEQSIDGVVNTLTTQVLSSSSSSGDGSIEIDLDSETVSVTGTGATSGLNMNASAGAHSDGSGAGVGTAPTSYYSGGNRTFTSFKAKPDGPSVGVAVTYKKSGDPAGGIPIQVIDAGTDDVLATGTTAADGTWESPGFSRAKDGKDLIVRAVPGDNDTFFQPDDATVHVSGAGSFPVALAVDHTPKVHVSVFGADDPSKSNSLAGADIKIETPDDSTVASGTTNSDGWTTGFLPHKLVGKKLTITQTSEPNEGQYSLIGVDTQTWTVPSSPGTYPVSFTDPAVYGNAMVKKTDTVTKQGIPGVGMTAWIDKHDGNDWQQLSGGASGETLFADGVYTTGTDGKVAIDGTKSTPKIEFQDEVKFVETSPATGYVTPVDTKNATVDIGADGSGDTTMSNSPKRKVRVLDFNDEGSMITGGVYVVCYQPKADRTVPQAEQDSWSPCPTDSGSGYHEIALVSSGWTTDPMDYALPGDKIRIIQTRAPHGYTAAGRVTTATITPEGVDGAPYCYSSGITITCSVTAPIPWLDNGGNGNNGNQGPDGPSSVTSPSGVTELYVKDSNSVACFTGLPGDAAVTCFSGSNVIGYHVTTGQHSGYSVAAAINHDLAGPKTDIISRGPFSVNGDKVNHAGAPTSPIGDDHTFTVNMNATIPWVSSGKYTADVTITATPHELAEG